MTAQRSPELITPGAPKDGLPAASRLAELPRLSDVVEERLEDLRAAGFMIPGLTRFTLLVEHADEDAARGCDLCSGHPDTLRLLILRRRGALLVTALCEDCYRREVTPS